MIAGLVLAGGESRRMGTDKALISVGGQSAALRAADWLSSQCDIVHISCREEQNIPVETSPVLQTVYDNPLFADKGPMTGLLSYLALMGIGNAAHLIVLGCDYRNITENVLSNLLAVGLTNNKICCYNNPITGIIDPLVAYYPMSILQHLPTFAETQSSLRAFIEQQPHHCIVPTATQMLALRSFDFPNETSSPDKTQFPR